MCQCPYLAIECVQLVICFGRTLIAVGAFGWSPSGGEAGAGSLHGLFQTLFFFNMVFVLLFPGDAFFVLRRPPIVVTATMGSGDTIHGGIQIQEGISNIM